MKGEMATSLLSSLVREIRERIAASSSSSLNDGDDDDVLVTKFRTVLPSLLNTYVGSSSTVRQREVVAVLKLIIHIARTFPGVFYHGTASSVLPVIGRVLPFFAEPTFSSLHGVVYDTIGSLLSLLRTGARDAYSYFCIDALLAVEDLSNMALHLARNSINSNESGLNITCFQYSFSGMFIDPGCLSELPLNSRPNSNDGILINITGKRWQLLATWIIKLLTKCLTEGNLYVEGLFNASNISAVCSLICYEEADLQMACFDFARMVDSVVDYNILPYENMIKSIAAILRQDSKEVPTTRDAAYDSSMGECLNALHSRCPDYTVRRTAVDLMKVFPRSLQKSQSQELKFALCSAYSRIARTCNPDIWMQESLIDMLCSSEPCPFLIDCFQVALADLGPDRVCWRVQRDDVDSSIADSVLIEHSMVGEKRHIHDSDNYKIKRQKVDEGTSVSDDVALAECNHMIEQYADRMGRSVLSFLELAKPPSGCPHSLSADVALAALSILCISFCKYPTNNLSLHIFQQMRQWIPWICNLATEGSPITVDIAMYLEAMHSILLIQSPFFLEDKALLMVLKIPWTHAVASAHPPLKAKCNSMKVVTKLGPTFMEWYLEIFDLCIHDEVEEVRIEAIHSMPLVIFWSGLSLLPEVFKRLELVDRDELEKVKKAVPLSLGFLSCLRGSCCSFDSLDKGGCKLSLDINNGIHNQTSEYLLQGFSCAKCDGNIMNNNEVQWKTIKLADLQSVDFGSTCDINHIVSLFFKLVYDDSSEDIQTGCVMTINRILRHLDANITVKTRREWVKCVGFLLAHKNKSVREAFCSQISSFLEDPILSWLFPEDDSSNQSKGKKFFDLLKQASMSADDPENFETLLKSTSRIATAVNIDSQLFLYSLLFLIDQLDHPWMSVRISVSRLIHESCSFHLRGGLKEIISKVVPFRFELFDYITMNLASRPKMVTEFAEAVFDVNTEGFVEKMVPTVLPKLVVSWHDSDRSVDSIFELAKYLDTDMVPLTVNWLPKVLAYALHQVDRQVLLSTLQFYHDQTGSDKQEIFAAALPALLDELVCFLDVGDPIEISQRLLRVPEIVKEIAKVLTGAENLPSFLRNHFVGLLNSIDRKMLHSEDFSLQKQALQRIRMLIEMMGSQLNTYVPKLMVLLMHSIEKEALQSDGLSVLHFFIERLTNISPSSTKHVISQVFAALIPLLDKHKASLSGHLDKVVIILEELVLKNRIILKQHIREFPPLPSIPALTEVNNAIQEARGSMTLKDQLRDVVGGLNHENLNVRYMVACELSKLLNMRRGDITILISGEVTTDMDIFSSLIRSLLAGCAEESRTVVGQRLKLVCADCLGALGAIDPAKVGSFSSQRFKIECSDDDLIFELIQKHLARAFRSAPDTVVQDSAALAIQELLKIAGCEASLDGNVVSSQKTKGENIASSKGMDNRGRKLWDRFSVYVKEIIAPCLTSRFQLPNVAGSTSIGPIYRPSMSFRRWIFSWIKRLTSHAAWSRASIFNACRGIVRHDMKIAIYLLPYLVLNAVCHGTEDARHGIAEEILAVLDAAASDNGGIQIHVYGGGQSEVCIQAVFTLLDNLGQWVDDVEQELALCQSSQLIASKKQTSKSKESSSVTLNDPNQLQIQCKHVSDLLTKIPKLALARASFRCRAYARSLMYFESHVRGKSGAFNPAAERSGIFEDNDISFLMEIYSFMDEPDGLSGLACLRKSLSLKDQLLISKKAGNWAEVLNASEQALQMEPESLQRHRDILNCLLNMCNLQAMVTHVDGLINRVPQYKKTWCMQGVEAAWRLGRWDLMDEYLNGADEVGSLCGSSESSTNTSFDMDVANILQAMMKKDDFAVAEKIALSKQALIAPLAAAGMDSYTRAYPFIVKLHLLQELEDFHSLLSGDSFLDKTFHPGDLEFAKLMENWENRLRLTQPSIWAREPLLAFRRLVFSASGLGALVGSCWLQYAKLCRLAGHYETASRAILEFQASGASNVHIEKAKLLWSTRRSDGAIGELQQYLLQMPENVVGTAAMSSIASFSLLPLNAQPTVCDTKPLHQNEDVAKSLLLYTRWIHCTGQKQKEDVITLYSRVRELQPKWEKGFFYMAKYCDELLIDARKRQEDNPELSQKAAPSASAVVSPSNPEKLWWHYIPEVLLLYAKGLHRGHKNLFQALPRLLTLWFDFGSMYPKRKSSSSEDLNRVHDKVMFVMRGCLKDLPTYQWLTVLPQLVSRICHQNEDIVKLVKSIIISVLRQYPQQALWMTAAVSKSIVRSRREAAASILQEAKKGFSQGSSESNLFVQFASLLDYLIKLCFHPVQPKARTLNIATEFSALKRMMPLGIIMPIQQSLTVRLPTSVSLPSYVGNLTDSLTSDVFSASDLPTISGIADEADVLPSLQRPKKIVLLGSDGIERPFICKPKDDLRKDARMMEFNAMINRLLGQYPESRRRKLYIRTFVVIPLTEDCGLVEWVPHTSGMRPILQDLYMACGKFDRQKTQHFIKKIYDQCQGKMPEDEMLKDKILPMFPPVLHKWFLSTFSEPAAWFRSRIAFAHTTAVWSMVGHIVGLGDRHGENILLDSTTGDCVHVDFSCLFDKGLQLEKPELVPFRLTQNVIDGLGITGYEGVFMKVSEITLSVLRTHRETLMSILETFVHDPLVEWTKSHKSSGVEVQNPHAQRAMNNIEARLQGVVVGVGAAPSLPLAVEGQARRLIAEAVSLKNLGKMYIWWMPWF